jgi:hypothetical protein
VEVIENSIHVGSFCMNVMLVNLCGTLIVTQIISMARLTIQWTQKGNNKWELRSSEQTWLIKFKGLWDITSTERFVVWITTNNLKLCYACSFYIVIRILYYYEFYIYEECHMEYFILYIEYHGNNQMCKICSWTYSIYGEKVFLYSYEK